MSLARIARLVAVAIVIGWSVANVIQRAGDWSLSDMDAYWNAAMRLREGDLLYPPVPDPAAVDIYKYAPWFAWLWVPFTFVPKVVVGVAWSAILVASSIVATVPLLRHRTLTGVAAASLIGSVLIWSAASGNVQPLLVAALVWAVERRSGPLWIGAAASLKIFPLIYAVVYVGRRQYGRAFAAAAVAGMLWLPILLYDLRAYQGGFADSPSPFLAIHPVVFAALALAAAVFALRAARTRYAWLAAAVAVFVSLPRVSLIDLSHMAVGAVKPDPDAMGQKG